MTTLELPDVDIAAVLKLPVIQPSVRSSGLTLWQECNWKYAMQEKLGIRPKHYRAALDLGTVFHEIRADLLLCKDVKGNELENHVTVRSNNRLREAVEKLIATTDTTGTLPTGQNAEWVEKAMRENHAKALALALWSWRVSPLDRSRYELFPLPGGTGVEQKVEVKLPGMGATIRLRLDAFLRDKQDGSLWISEHKTCGNEGTIARSAMLTFEVQPRVYRLAVHTLLKSLDLGPERLKGTLHSIVIKPQIKQRTVRQPETFPEYLARLTGVYDERQSAWRNRSPERDEKGPPFLYSRIEYDGPPMDAELYAILRNGSAAAGKKVISTGVFPRNASACMKWGSACAFLPFCQSPVSSWESILGSGGYEVSVSRDDDDDLRHMDYDTTGAD